MYTKLLHCGSPKKKRRAASTQSINQSINIRLFDVKVISQLSKRN